MGVEPTMSLDHLILSQAAVPIRVLPPEPLKIYYKNSYISISILCSISFKIWVWLKVPKVMP
jgi:hypothetical protein